MSAIPPSLPSALYPSPAGQAPVRAARSDFFRTALAAVQATPTPSAPTIAAPTTAAPAAAAPRPTSEAAVERSTRPGALLDIRV